MGNIEKFNSIANQYDTPERIKTAGIIAEEIRAHIVEGQEKDALDYGCGTGLVGMALLDAFRSILFTDASPRMVMQVRQKIEQMDIRTADTLCSDFLAEVPSGLQVDYILVTQVMLHVKEVEELLRRLYLVLNEGGHLLIVDFDKNDEITSSEVHNGFEQQELLDIAAKLGFKKAEAKTFYHGERIFMNKDASLMILDAQK